ncbi:MAG: hypothetical protein EBZ36_16830, partial [Acidobacteria bacterium]|nr:hypothetical protein [Acidobacteriota bacterium]
MEICRETKRLSGALMLLMLLIFLGTAMSRPSLVQGSGNTGGVRVTSAAYDSREAPLAPESLASAYQEPDGSRLSVATAVAESPSLPTKLGGTTVTVRGYAAGLLFVSPA